MVILSIGQFINVATGSVSILLTMCGYEKLIRSYLIVFAILSLLLIPKFGLLGAASVTTLIISLRKIAFVVGVYRKLSINMLPIPNR